MIETMLAEAVDSWELDDPLLRLVEQLCNGSMRTHEETVNLSALFSCQGAISDAEHSDSANEGESSTRVRNAEQVAELAAASGWSPRLPHPTLRSGVLLLQAEREETRRQAADWLRSTFQDNGVVLTAYGDGLIRLSMPTTPLQQHDLDLIKSALRRVA
jgi:predicted HD phosphohydrolase